MISLLSPIVEFSLSNHSQRALKSIIIPPFLFYVGDGQSWGRFLVRARIMYCGVLPSEILPWFHASVYKVFSELVTQKRTDRQKVSAIRYWRHFAFSLLTMLKTWTFMETNYRTRAKTQVHTATWLTPMELVLSRAPPYLSMDKSLLSIIDSLTVRY